MKPDYLVFNEKLSNDVIELIKNILKIEPSERFTMD